MINSLLLSMLNQMRKYELILKSNMVSHDRMDNRPIAKQMVTFLVPWHKESCEVLSQRVMWGIITKSHVKYYHKESCEVLSQSHVRYYHRVMWGIITKSHVRYYRKESCEVLSQRVMWGIITKSHVRYYRHFVSVAIIVFVWEYFIF
jgi:ribosomal protein L35AE/L33A